MEQILTKQHTKLMEMLCAHVEEGLCVAFSGGVDSSLLLKAACEAGRDSSRPVLAVTFSTALHPSNDAEECRKMAAEFGAQHKIIHINEFSHESITNNPVDRCYHCKLLLFNILLETAKVAGYHYIMDGSNYDDLKAYRPGMKALGELHIHSPLLELEFTKEQIRALAKELKVPCFQKPSAPCLATRLPYNTPFDFALLRKIEKGEDYLKNLGLYNVRLRLHEDIMRIEVDIKDFPVFLSYRENIVKQLKELGFLYITLDLEGFRSGSMDIKITELN